MCVKRWICLIRDSICKHYVYDCKIAWIQYENHTFFYQSGRRYDNHNYPHKKEFFSSVEYNVPCLIMLSDTCYSTSCNFLCKYVYYVNILYFVNIVATPLTRKHWCIIFLDGHSSNLTNPNTSGNWWYKINWARVAGGNGRRIRWNRYSYTASTYYFVSWSCYTDDAFA